MDQTGRKITKIAREVGKFTVQTMKEEGIGTAEFDFIHLVRHNPGITQTEVRETLKIDKGAAARRAASLEAKGYLERKPNPADGRSQLLYATKKAEAKKNSKASNEAVFYEWLLAELPEEEFDSPLGTGTGAAVIFGTTGGVMEAALRTCYYVLTGENPSADETFKAVRALGSDQPWIEAEYNVAGHTVRAAVVNGLGNEGLPCPQIGFCAQN